jgi:NAD(P)-dependent dehydrogenase (short-subunit alcohol dehydrogenase family)
VVVAVGGARGVTAACLEELAGRVRLRFALLGRTRLGDPADEPEEVDETALVGAVLARAKARGKSLTPAEARAAAHDILAAREVRGTVERLRKAGSEAMYLAADCNDAAGARAAVEDVRRCWGSPRAVVFAAGVLADKLIAEKTPAQFDRVFGTKVAGLANVLAATAADPLKCLLLFSSVAARTGNRGQCDYAAANEVLNQVALAEARRRTGCLVRSFCWGPWDGGMVTPALRQHFAARGVSLLSVRAGARAFVAELAGTPGDTVLVVGGGLDPSPKATETRQFHVLVSSQSHPHLADHAVRDVPVLPAVLVAEWFARAARSAYPGRRLAELVDLRILRGLPLPDFGTRPQPLAVRVLPDDDPARVRFELRDPTGHVRYSAGGVLAAADEVRPSPAFTAAAGEGDWPIGLDEIYDGPLFHGPAFRAVVGLDSAGAEGGVGRVVGATELDWQGGPFVTGPAALDGCMQLVMAWWWDSLRRRALPTRIGRLVFCSPEQPAGELSCHFRAEPHRDSLSADALLRDSAGRPILFLGGLELVAMHTAREALVG